MKELHFQDKTIMFGTYEELGVYMGNLCFTAVCKDLLNTNMYHIVFDQKFV